MNQSNNVPSFQTETLLREIEFNLWEVWSNFGRGPGCSLHTEEDMLWFETPIPIIPYNAVIKFQVTKNIDRRIAHLINHFKQREVPFFWIVHPSSAPVDLSERLLKQGLQHIEVAPGMARGLDDLPASSPLPEGVEIREAMEKSDVNELHEFAAWRWGVPIEHRQQLKAMIERFKVGEPGSKTRMWLAWRDGTPIAKIGLYLGEESAGIYGVVTKPEARGLGLASILMVEAMKAARDAGQKLVVLHSSPLAEKLYTRLGFVSVAPLNLFASETAYL